MTKNAHVVLLLLATFGCRPRADAQSNYLALGDSYTCGESVPEADSYPFQLASKLKADGNDVGRPTVVAVTGWTTGKLAAGIDVALLNSKYELVTLLIGVNDQYRHRTIDDFRTHFADLVRRSVALAGGRAGHVVVISIPDWGVMPFAHGTDVAQVARQIDAFNDVVKIESTRAGVRWVDVTAISRTAATQPAMDADDGLHPSGMQYSKWVAAILPVATLAISDSTATTRPWTPLPATRR